MTVVIHVTGAATEVIGMRKIATVIVDEIMMMVTMRSGSVIVNVKGIVIVHE